MDINGFFLSHKRKKDEENIDSARCTYAWKNLYILFYKNKKFQVKTNFSTYEKSSIEYVCEEYKINITRDMSFSFKNK